MNLVNGQFLVERFKIISLEDAINVSWVSEHELDNYQFPPNVKEYVIKAFKHLYNR